jgi:hypothetical protein
MCVCRVVSCPTTDPDGPRRVYVITGNRSSVHFFFVHRCVGRCWDDSNIDYTGVSCVNVWNHCVYTSSSTPIARMHSCVCLGTGRWEWMDGWMACVHSCRLSSTREETDGFERRTERDHRHRSHRTRLSRVSLALSLERRISFIHSFTHSFIHSFRCERTNERRDEGTTGRAREGRERDGLDRRVRSHPIARAREEVRASVSNARRIERIESRVHFKPPIHRRRSRRMRRGMNATE